MNCGNGKRNAEGDLEFEIAFPLLPSFRMILKPHPNAGRTDKAWPAFVAYVGRQECGAVWKKTSKQNTDYLTGHIDSPCFAGGRVSFRIFKSNDESRRGEMDVIWDRASEKPSSNQSAPGSTPQSPPAAPGSQAGGDVPPF